MQPDPRRRHRVAENGSSFAVDVELKVNGASALKEKLAAGSLVTLPELAQKE